jgi:hypothetical protein
VIKARNGMDKLNKPPQLDIHRGPAANIDAVEHGVRKLEDAAEMRSVLCRVVHGIMPELALEYDLDDAFVSTFEAHLQADLTGAVGGSLKALTERAVEVLRDTMVTFGYERPGLRDAFLLDLEEAMKVRIAE